VEQRILELVANHPTIKAIQNGVRKGEALLRPYIDDFQLLELERTLTKELGEGDLEVTPENLKKVFAHSADSFLGLVRQVLDMQYLPDYKDVVARQFENFIIENKYNADQIRFLRAVQSVFLQKRHLETADLYDARPRWLGLVRMLSKDGLRSRKWHGFLKVGIFSTRMPRICQCRE